MGVAVVSDERLTLATLPYACYVGQCTCSEHQKDYEPPEAEHAHGHAHKLSGRFHAHEHPVAQRHWWPEPEVPLTDGHLAFLLRQSIEYEKAKKAHAL